MKKRVLSAAVLIAIFIPLIIIGGIPFKIAIGIVSILTYKEVIDLKKKDKDLPSLIKILGVISLLLIIFVSSNNYLFEAGLSYVSIGVLLLSLLIPAIFMEENKYSMKDAFYLIGWTLFLGVFYNALEFLVNENLILFFYLILITVLNDTFALMFGKLIGSHKLIPSVSPGKTWEGSICGAVLGTFIAVMYYLNLYNPTANIVKLIVMTLVLSIIGQLGDLVFSKIKREYKVKDFSKLIPGHGGLLDRFDSLSFVVIAFLIMLKII